MTTAPSRMDRPECEPPADGHAVGVAGDEAHPAELDAEPLGDELGEAGLMALPGRQRTERDLHLARGANGDLGALAGRARC